MQLLAGNLIVIKVRFLFFCSQKQLTNDPETYEEFLRTLATSSEEQCSPVEVGTTLACLKGPWTLLCGDLISDPPEHFSKLVPVREENLFPSTLGGF